MNAAIVWRIFWKEYRTLRGFWIGMAVFGLLVMLYEYLFLIAEMRPVGIYGAALGLPAFYALGCGAVMFAAERESETSEWLRALPMQWFDLFASKLAAALTSLLALVGFLLVFAVIGTSGEAPPAGVLHHHIPMWGVAALEGLAWGMFFSLVLGSPIRAAALGAAAAAFVTQSMIYFAFTGATRLSDITAYVEILPFRLLVVACVSGVNVFLASRWLSTSSSAGLASIRKPTSAGDNASLAAESSHSEVASFRRKPRSAFLSMLWQNARQRRWEVAVVTSAALILGGFVVATEAGAEQLVATFVVLGSAFFALLGAFTFHGDQRKACFRFFADHGISPRLVWLSRQFSTVHRAAWIAGIAFVLFLSANDWSMFGVSPQVWGVWKHVGWSCFIALAAGQFCSMFLRSDVLVLVSTVALTAVVLTWYLISSALNANAWWSVFPIPASLYVATWLRAPDWLLERNGWRPWTKTGAIVGIPLALALTSFAYHRAYEIPKVDPGFSPAQFAAANITAEGRETAAMYRRAAELLSPHLRGSIQQMRKFVAENQESLDMALAATERSECTFYAPDPTEYQAEPAFTLQSLFLTSADLLCRNGDVEGGLDRYMAALRLSRRLRSNHSSFQADSAESWVYQALVQCAARRELSSDRLRTLIVQLEEFEHGLPSLADEIKWEYLVSQRTIELWKDDPAALLAPFNRMDRTQVSLILATHYMPWEHERAKRLLDLMSANSLENVTAFERQVDSRETPPILYGYNSELANLAESSPFQSGYLEYRLLGARGHDLASSLKHRWIKMMCERRATRLILAILAWRKDNGELPASLDELPAADIKESLIDPYTSLPFQYFPEGLPPMEEPMSFSWTIPANTPFLRSPGHIINVNNEAENSLDPKKWRFRGDLFVIP